MPNPNMQDALLDDWDVVSLGETMLRLTPPRGGRLETAAQLDSYVAGSESNTLAGMARLGLRAAWLSRLPDNPNGRRVASELRSAGVDVSRIAWVPDGRLGTFFAEESPAPLGPQVIYDRAGSVFARLDPEAFDLEPIRRARLLHLTGITPALGAGPRTAFNRAAEIAEQAGVPVSFDVNYRAKLWTADEAAKGLDSICRRARVLICASVDAAALWGFQGEPEAVLDAMAGRFGGSDEKTIVLTLGADGSAMRHGNGFTYASALSTGGRERFGSGDAFGAGFLAAWLGIGSLASLVEEGFSPLACGNAMAALKRCIAGDIAIVTPGEVERLLRTDGHGYFR